MVQYTIVYYSMGSYSSTERAAVVVQNSVFYSIVYLLLYSIAQQTVVMQYSIAQEQTYGTTMHNTQHPIDSVAQHSTLQCSTAYLFLTSSSPNSDGYTLSSGDLVQCNTVQQRVVQYSITQNVTVQYSAQQYSIVQYAKEQQRVVL